MRRPPDRNGWQHVPVDPRVMAARVAGISHGFLAFDDTGSEWTRNGETFHVPAFPQSFRLQPRAEPRKRTLLHDRARTGRPPASRRPLRPASRARNRSLASR